MTLLGIRNNPRRAVWFVGTNSTTTMCRTTPLVFLLIAFLFAFRTNAQLRKQVIDEELLTSLVQAKQEEIKARALTNLVRNNVRTLNKTTYNTMYDMVDILITEKNKTVMTRALVGKAADYAISYAATRYMMLKYNVFPGGSKDKGKNLSADKLAELIADDYKTEQKSGGLSRGDNPIRIDGTTSYDVGVDNWLLDHVYIELANEPLLKAKGLFRKESDRTWEYDTAGGAVDYPAFWAKHGTAKRDAIMMELHAFTAWLKTNLGRLDQVAGAVAADNWAALSNLDLKDLGVAPGPVPNAGVIGNSEVQQVMALFMHALELYRNHVGQNSTLVRIGDIINQYFVFDPERLDKENLYGFSIDVEGIILSFEDKVIRSTTSPTKRSWLNLRPFFTIGLNYGYFRSFDTTFTETQSLGLSQVAWAGEKLGFKWYLWDWKYTRGQQANEPYRFHGRMWTRNVRPRDPLFSNWYVSLYTSGLLYTIADLRSEREFNSAIVGLGSGVRFFNGLEVNASYAAPIIAGATIQEDIDAGFWNVGLDIPIFEYIRELRAKRAQ